MPSDTVYVAVVGTGEREPGTDAAAQEIGRLIAEGKGVLVCGGLGGVMEAACKGAKDGGGTTVGILPSDDRRHANPYVDVAIATGMGEMRNALIVRTADVVIAVGGEYGTLSEIAFALKIGRPVVGLGSWDLAKAKQGATGVIDAASPADAVAGAFGAVRTRLA